MLHNDHVGHERPKRQPLLETLAAIGSYGTTLVGAEQVIDGLLAAAATASAPQTPPPFSSAGYPPSGSAVRQGTQQ